MKTIVLSLGSNLGNRKENLKRAVNLLAKNGIRILKISRPMETKPWGNLEQPDFVNMVLIGETTLSPLNLLSTIKNIEKTMGRTSGHMEPRTIDIDIIFYEGIIIKSEKLQIPHKDFKEREFVLKPLYEIEPYLKDPETGKIIRDLYTELSELPQVMDVETPIGKFHVGVKDGKIIKSGFDAIRGKKVHSPLLYRIKNKLLMYFEGNREDFTNIPVNIDHLPIVYRKILLIVRKIPFGSIITYKDMAELSGIKNGARVAGNAMRKNPIPIIIPCHRVVRKGEIGNYSYGKKKKEFLLKLELKDNFFNIFTKST